MSECVVGRNGLTEILAEQLLPVEYIMSVLTEESCPLTVCLCDDCSWMNSIDCFFASCWIIGVSTLKYRIIALLSTLKYFYVMIQTSRMN